MVQYEERKQPSVVKPNECGSQLMDSYNDYPSKDKALSPMKKKVVGWNNIYRKVSMSSLANSSGSEVINQKLRSIK
jgi:hypothetical protein